MWKMCIVACLFIIDLELNFVVCQCDIMPCAWLICLWITVDKVVVDAKSNLNQHPILSHADDCKYMYVDDCKYMYVISFVSH